MGIFQVTFKHPVTQEFIKKLKESEMKKERTPIPELETPIGQAPYL